MIASCTPPSTRTRPLLDENAALAGSVLAADMLCVTNITDAAAAADILDLADALLLKRDVAHREHFVHQQNLAVEVPQRPRRRAAA